MLGGGILGVMDEGRREAALQRLFFPVGDTLGHVAEGRLKQQALRAQARAVVNRTGLGASRLGPGFALGGGLAVRRTEQRGFGVIHVGKLLRSVSSQLNAGRPTRPAVDRGA